MWLNLLGPEVRDCVSNSVTKEQPNRLWTLYFMKKSYTFRFKDFPSFCFTSKIFFLFRFLKSLFRYPHSFIMDRFSFLLYTNTPFYKWRKIAYSASSRPQNKLPLSCLSLSAKSLDSVAAIYDSKSERYKELL